MNGKKAKALRRAQQAAQADPFEMDLLEAMQATIPAAIGPGRARVRNTKRIIAEARTRRRLATYLGHTAPDPAISTTDLAAQVARKSARQGRSKRAQ